MILYNANWLILTICLVCFSCHEKKTLENKQIPDKANDIQQSTDVKPLPKKQKWIQLSDENLISVLTEYGKENPETLVEMKTPKGTMKIRLYENTPLHRANFIRLIKNNFYKGTEFYRVIDHFMIQGGDNDDWARKSLKDKMGKYTIPAEYRKENIHQKGALSMAREYKDNPEKRSVPFEFFIVQGYKYSPEDLIGTEKNYSLKISPEHKAIYQKMGGCAHLDGEHTVFGQVIEGLDVIDSIAAVKTDEGDWPIEKMSIELRVIE